MFLLALNYDTCVFVFALVALKRKTEKEREGVRKGGEGKGRRQTLNSKKQTSGVQQITSMTLILHK